MSEESAPAGWYPQSDGSQRYWDGDQWTDQISETPAETPVPSRKGRGCLVAMLVMAALFVLLIGFWTVNYFRGSKQDATAEIGATTACGTPATAPGFEVQLGTPYLADGKDLVPVTLTNNTNTTHDVIVVLQQYDIDGCQPLEGQIPARFDNLGPGQTGQDDAGSGSRLVPTLSLQGMAYQVSEVNVFPAKGSPYSQFDPGPDTN